MGTLFSMVDKLVSSLGSTIVGAAVAVIGITTLPDSTTPYAPGMEWVVVVLFCVVPMIAWIATLIAMKGYTLTRKADERDSGSQREAQGRHRRGHEPGRGHGKI